MYNSKIQWTESTVNFWQGCHKISEGCKYCYMFRIKSEDGRNGNLITRTSDKTFYQALYWKEPHVIFTCSMSDFFLEEADEWREDAWDVIRRTPQHTWQILTKRPDRIKECLPPDWGNGWSNVWLGVTVENQKHMSRVKVLSEIPSVIRFISAEPMLEELNFLVESEGKRLIDDIHWIILGGESGEETGAYRYRPAELDWFRRAINDLKSQTSAAVFMKQTGSHLKKVMGLKGHHGGDITEWPKDIQVREMPVIIPSKLTAT